MKKLEIQEKSKKKFFLNFKLLEFSLFFDKTYNFYLKVSIKHKMKIQEIKIG